MAIASINPATGEKLKGFTAFNDAEIERRLKRAEHAFQQHRRESFPKRAMKREQRWIAFSERDVINGGRAACLLASSSEKIIHL